MTQAFAVVGEAAAVKTTDEFIAKWKATGEPRPRAAGGFLAGTGARARWLGSRARAGHLPCRAPVRPGRQRDSRLYYLGEAQALAAFAEFARSLSWTRDGPAADPFDRAELDRSTRGHDRLRAHDPRAPPDLHRGQRAVETSAGAQRCRRTRGGAVRVPPRAASVRTHSGARVAGGRRPRACRRARRLAAGTSRSRALSRDGPGGLASDDAAVSGTPPDPRRRSSRLSRRDGAATRPPLPR